MGIRKKEIYELVDSLQTSNEKLVYDFLRNVIDAQRLQKNIRQPDLDSDDYSIQDFLDCAGIITPEQAEKMLEEVKQSREEWDED